MANLNAFNSNSASNSTVNNTTTNATVVNPPANQVDNNEASFIWGEEPTVGQYVLVETTLSGKSFKAPTPGVQNADKTLAKLWPGSLHWTESQKQAGAIRLFAKLNAMVLQRDSNGVPILDEEGELTWKDGIKITLCKQGITKKQKQDIEGLEAMKAAKPEMAIVIDGLIANMKAQTGWVKQPLNSKSFVTALCNSGDTILPVVMYLNMAFNAKEAQDFVKAAQKLSAKGEPGLLRFYIPMEQMTMPKEEWKPVKVKVGNALLDMKNPNTGEVIMGPEFSWGNRTQPIAKIELIPGKYLPSSEGMDRVLSVEETAKRVTMMEREWQAKEETNLFLWSEALKGKFSSSGNQWAHKAGALPKRSAGVYASSCTLWEDAKESAGKLEKWSEALRALVGKKPRLNEENQKGNDNQHFSAEACEAIIASAKVQDIQPWLNYINGIGGTVKVTPAVVVAAQVIEPEVQAIMPTVPVVEEAQVAEVTQSDEPSEADILAAIYASREAAGLGDIDDEDEYLVDDFFRTQE